MSETTPPRTTTDAGIPAASDEHSLTVGQDGPILLQDHYLIQKMAQFNRERVPERVVHAKGGAAHGFFEVTEDVTQWTCASFLSQVGKRTPIFFVKDPSKFQDFIHSQKRMPDTHTRSNNAQWDFWSLSPESCHQVQFLMSDRGTPRTWRNMNGYGSHTYMWVNAGGERFWVKYHFKTVQGIENFTDAQAKEMAAEDPDYHLRDLFESIARGEAPEWRLEMQIMPFDDAKDYRFNPFDLTKVWPHGDYPPVTIGRLVLNRNPENYFAEVEQASFEPANMVRGIGPSPDRMLLGRLFSYPDTHRYRIGPNYLQLPINRPKSEVHSYNKDGAMRYEHAGTQPVYAPNSFGGPKADPSFADPSWSADGEIVRAAQRLHSDDDDYGQAGALFREVLSLEDRDHLVGNIVGHLGTDVMREIQERAVSHWRKVDAELGARIAAGLGLEGSNGAGDGAAPEHPGQPAAQGERVEGAAEPARG
jgi:catalase